MSTAHASPHAGADHVPHVTPLDIYLKTFGTLMVLTVITVGASYVNLGTTVNLILALIIATIKATVVAAFFMHLAADHKFHTIVFVSGIVFLLIFVAFTMFDTEFRGKLESVERDRPGYSGDPFAAPTSKPAMAPAAAPSGN
jgi:cytochrome c oxidase subunit 4